MLPVNEILLFLNRFPPGLVFIVFLLLWVGIGWLVEKIFFAGLARIAKKTSMDWDDVFINAAQPSARLIILVVGVFVALHLILPPALMLKLVKIEPSLLKGLVALAAVLFVDRFATGIIQSYAKKTSVVQMSQGFFKVTARVIIYSVGFLIVIDTLGISITPILASLGVGSLAIALALQSTLENLISGFQVLVDKMVKPGDFIRLETGEEGFVERVGWRSTWIRQLPNNTVIIPNKTLVNSRVLNYCYPSKELAVLVELGVHYNSDLARVESSVLKVAANILATVPGGVADFQPLVRFTSFGESSINLIAVLRAKEFTDSAVLRHEFIKAIAKQFRADGIVIPYPIVALNSTQEKS